MNNHYSIIEGGVCAAKGFLANAVSCGIKDPNSDRLDLALIYSNVPCVSSGVFTTNKVKAACVKLTVSSLKKGNLRAIVANSGNANACTGDAGMKDAKKICRDIAREIAVKPSEVGLCSTGVIGLPMPMKRILPKIHDLAADIEPGKGDMVAKAIMTSDTFDKQIAVEVMIKGKPVRIGACCKGAGMISPCMATMLCFITTDAKLDRKELECYTKEAVDLSFNRITIDGDMSTNDTVIVMANGSSGVSLEREEDKEVFQDALKFVMLDLAKRIVKDGERVTKFVTVSVEGARSEKDARLAAEAVSKSFLVKSSWNGNDPNWGRILHAVGYSGASLVEKRVDIDIAGLAACRGGLQAETSIDKLREAVAAPEFSVNINLNRGRHSYSMYTTDISPEYVDFNRSEYAYWNQAKADCLIK